MCLIIEKIGLTEALGTLWLLYTITVLSIYVDDNLSWSKPALAIEIAANPLPRSDITRVNMNKIARGVITYATALHR